MHLPIKPLNMAKSRSTTGLNITKDIFFAMVGKAIVTKALLRRNIREVFRKESLQLKLAKTYALKMVKS